MTLDRRAPHNELSTSLTLYLHCIRVKAIFKMLERKCNVLQRNCREQWWRSGESTPLPPMWPRFDSQTYQDHVTNWSPVHEQQHLAKKHNSLPTKPYIQEMSVEYSTCHSFVTRVHLHHFKHPTSLHAIS